MSADLQQSLSELQALFDQPGGAKDEVSKRLAKLKLELAQSGLYFAPPTGDVQQLAIARSILEIGVFHSLRMEDLKLYRQYNSSLQPFYDNLNSILSPSPNRPMTLGLQLLYFLSAGQLTEFHTTLETLDAAQMSDDFVRLPVDLERWLMEGAYNKVYRARERVPRPEFGFLLERLMGTVRSQIAATIEASYPSLGLQNAASLLFFKSGETSEILTFGQTRGWTLSPTTQTFTFATLTKADDVPLTTIQVDEESPLASGETLQGRGGVRRGVPMRTMVGPALKLAQQLEAIV